MYLRIFTGYNVPVLKTLRKHRGLTQTQLAKQARTSQPYIACLERGEKKNPSLAVLRRLAKALGTTVGELVRDDNLDYDVSKPIMRRIPVQSNGDPMTPQKIRQFADDALALRQLLIVARRDPALSPDERKDYDALSQLCTKCLVLTDMLDDMLKKGRA